METAVTAQQDCLGSRSNCSEDDIETGHARKEKRFPGFDLRAGDGQGSFGWQGTGSFTRWPISPGATSQ